MKGELEQWRPTDIYRGQPLQMPEVLDFSIASGSIRQQVTMPPPPSTNNLYRTGRGHKGKAGRFKTTEYKRWQLIAGAAISRAGVEPIAPKTVLAVRIVVDINRQRDIDNVAKPILDILQAKGTVPDDRYIDHLVVHRYRVDPVEHCRVMIWGRPASLDE